VVLLHPTRRRLSVRDVALRSVIAALAGSPLACQSDTGAPGELTGGKSFGAAAGMIATAGTGATSGAGVGTGGAPGTGGASVIIVGGTSSMDPTGGSAGTPPAGPCEGLQCRQATCTLGSCTVPACAAGTSTTVSGTVYDPSGTLELYNVMVYVPNAALEPLVEGANCNTCDVTVSGKPVTSAITNEAGQFVLPDVPVGANVPLVIQVGKWRKEVTIANVTACTDNPIVDKNMTRLPANQTEGHMPRIAISTGELDALECLLRKIGISDSEFTNPDGTGRINLFAGHEGTNAYAAGGDFPVSEESLWDATTSLKAYDVVLFSCEGGQFPQEKPDAARAALLEYLDDGGRAFLSHWHKIWLEQGPDPLPTVMNFNDSDDDQDFTADIDTSFPKGAALAQWLVNVEGSTVLGKVDLLEAQNTAADANPGISQRWIYQPLDPFTNALSAKYVSANTPVAAAADAKCGRVVYSDIHVSSGDTSSVDDPFPSGCTSQGLSPQEKVLIFMLFDLSACLIPDDVPPKPPEVVK
jgi:hypothetical protein